MDKEFMSEARVKYWNERNLEEKVEALRDTIEMLCNIVNELSKLKDHIHGPTGHVAYYDTYYELPSFRHVTLPDSLKIEGIHVFGQKSERR